MNDEEAVGTRELLQAMRELQTDYGLVGVTVIVEIGGGEHLHVSVTGDVAPVVMLADEHDNVHTLNPELLT